MGNLSCQNLAKAIDNAKNINLNRFIYSIGIRHIGQENAKILAQYFKTKEKFKDLYNPKKRIQILSDLKDLDGIGETQINSIDKFFQKKINIEIIDSFILELNILNHKDTNKTGKLSNKNIMFTGGFEKMSRSEAKTMTENLGGKVLGSISRKLDFLVVGESKPTKNKIIKAKELRIKILTESEWYKILNV